jgi:DNA-binding transcriptional regulator YdaS (Cro superfamily)
VSIDELKERFGGAHALARALGVQRNTLNMWHLRGAIPDAVKWRILEASLDRGLGVQPTDLRQLERTSAS